MSKKWYEKLGVEQNPFTTTPLLDREHSLVEREKAAKEVLYRILSHNMLFIEGAKGSGKTSLLKYAIDHFKGKGKVIYYDASQLNRQLNIEQLLSGARKYSPTRDKFPKDMILLLDNIDDLSAQNNERIKYFFDQNYIKSAIFTGQSYAGVSFSESIRSRIGKRIITLKPLTDEAAVEIINERLAGKNNGFLPNQTIRYIYALSKNDLKQLLINCYVACEYASKHKKSKVTKDLVDKALKDGIKKTSDAGKMMYEDSDALKKAIVCEVCNGQLIKISEHYRCKHCDTFCTNCGALVDPEDKQCPECGTSFD